MIVRVCFWYTGHCKESEQVSCVLQSSTVKSYAWNLGGIQHELRSVYGHIQRERRALNEEADRNLLCCASLRRCLPWIRGRRWWRWWRSAPNPLSPDIVNPDLLGIWFTELFAIPFTPFYKPQFRAKSFYMIDMNHNSLAQSWSDLCQFWLNDVTMTFKWKNVENGKARLLVAKWKWPSWLDLPEFKHSKSVLRFRLNSFIWICWYVYSHLGRKLRGKGKGWEILAVMSIDLHSF